MKRYLVQLTALSLLVLATGCQKEQGEINNPQNNQSAAVNISIDGLSIDAASSRAVIADMPDFSKNGFKIAGYYTVGLPPVLPDDPAGSGRFDDNITTAFPNVFDANGKIGESVIVPELKGGKYHVTLSQWALSENSFLSYFAWASNVDAGVAEGAPANPITNSTKHGNVGAPFIRVTSGSASASLNVDVVAAKLADNSNDVVRSAIDLNFKHVMTKLKFNVKNSSLVNMTLTGAKIRFAATKVSRNAKYSFDGSTSHIGTWSDYTNTEAATYPVTLTNTNLASNANAVHLEELLIIPQALTAGAISVELTYTIPNGATASTYTRTVPLKARTVEQNTSYTYEISLNETTISINEGRIGAWIDTSTGDLPYIAGARDLNVQLLLDAYDAPYTHTDGNKYWLDRSGWNRHCKLVGGVTYDAAGKFYKFSDSPVNASYVEVPPTFTATAGATFEIITRSTRPSGEAGNQKLFDFINAASLRVMLCHLQYNGTENYYFDAGGNNRVTSTMPMSLYREFAMYSFSKSMSSQYMRRNLSYYDNSISTGGNAVVDLSTVANAKIGAEFKGDIRYFKISSTAKTTIDDTEYAALSKRHRVKDYVNDGLIVQLNGLMPSSVVAGKIVWEDMSRKGNHAEIVGSMPRNATKNGYVSTTNASNYMKFVKTLGNVPEITVEIITKSDGTYLSGQNIIMCENRPTEWPGVNIFAIAWPYSSVDALIDMPFSNSSWQRIWVKVADMKAPLTSISQLSLSKSATSEICLKQNGMAYPSITNTMAIPELKNMYLCAELSGDGSHKIINKFSGEIYAVRIYNRALTAAEQAQNYEVDRQYYNMP